jgi:hypothetical protein
MPHIVLIAEAMEALEARMSDPPSLAQANLHGALGDADTWAHDHEDQTDAIASIEDTAGAIKGYLTFVVPPQDNRLQSYADELDGLIA